MHTCPNKVKNKPKRLITKIYLNCPNNMYSIQYSNQLVNAAIV